MPADEMEKKVHELSDIVISLKKKVTEVTNEVLDIADSLTRIKKEQSTTGGKIDAYKNDMESRTNELKEELGETLSELLTVAEESKIYSNGIKQLQDRVAEWGK